MTNTQFQPLHTNYKQACDDILRLFCETYELPYNGDEWVGREEGTVACIGDYFIDFHDMMTMLENSVPFDTFLQHYDYVTSARLVGLPTPNLQSWILGCPRLPLEEMEDIEQKKWDYELALDKAKTEIFKRK